jgi:hypothetical protein
MKKTVAVLVTMFVAATAVLAWQYSAQTAPNGSHHEDGTTNFTPGSTTAYVSECSPDLSSYPCPAYSQEPPYCFDYISRAKLTQGSNSWSALHQCGGNAYSTARDLSTSQAATISAQIIETCVTTPISGMGPVTAWAANPQVSCSGSSPGH